MSDKIPVINPQGKPVFIAKEQLPLAQTKGYTIETPEQEQERHEIDEAVKHNDNLMGSLKVAGKSFINQFAGGIPEAIENSGLSDLDKKKNEAIKNSHDIAGALGGLTGFGASMALPVGVLGRAAKLGTEASKLVEGGIAAESLIGRLGQKAVGGAVEGALAGAPQSIAHVIEGDPQQAGETLLAGAGIGAALAPLRLGLEAISPHAQRLAAGAQKFATESPEVLTEGAQKAIDFGTGQVAKKALGFAGLSHGPLGYLAGEGLGEMIAPRLRKMAEDYGGAQRLAGIVQNQMDKLPEYLEKITAGEGVFRKAMPMLESAAATAGVKLANQKDWEDHIAQVNRLAEKPPIQSDSPYEQALDVQQQKAAQYLQSQLPPIDLLPKPFEPYKPVLPDEEQTKEYLEKVALVQNPFHLFTKLQDGTLKEEDMDAVKKVYPKLLSKMQSDIAALGLETKHQKVSPDKKRLLGIFLGQPLVDSFQPSFVKLTQDMYKQNNNQVQKFKPTKVAGPDLSTSLQKVQGS